ncbi:MAG: glycosyltransferase family 4 protein [Microthrixaceae bacterium]|nr:glycosyltransferase family 4 protein [Microthrixaceae bacterium]
MTRPRLVHLTTTDISLELLLGPQLSAFIDAGYEVIGVSAPGDFVEAIEARGVRHIPLVNATRSMAPHKDLAALGELHRLFRRERPTIVHTHNPKPGLYGRVAARTAGVPVVLNTVHGLYATPDDDWKKRAVVYGLERLASSCSQAELVQNPEDLVTLRRVVREPASKLMLLGNGVDLTRFAARPAEQTRAQVRDGWGADDATVVVGAVGRLVLEKGYAELFEAWRSLNLPTSKALLVVAGPVDSAKADSVPQSILDEAKEAGIVLLGLRSDVEDLYTAMDAYVLASHREGFPRSAMEAAACGLPMVATDIRGCRQVVDHRRTGLLTPVRDSRLLAESLRELIDDKELRTGMGVAAADKARRDFDQRRVIDTTLATYERLLRANDIRPPDLRR